MKIKHYSHFNHELGKLRGISEVIKSDKIAASLINIAQKMEELWIEITKQQVIEKRIETSKAGPVTRPLAEKLNKTPLQEQTETEMEKAFEEIT